MKKCLSILIFFLYLLTTLINAQESKFKKENIANSSNKIEGVTTTNDKVTIKDGTSTLLEVTNEGGGGSITLPSLSTIGTNTNKLYNLNGSLFWKGFALGTAGSAGGWTDDGTNIYNTTLTDNVGIGITNPAVKLHVNGIARFDLGNGQINITTPGSNPGIIAYSPNGNRREIVFQDNAIKLLTSPTASASPPTNGISILESGKVGIGTSTPETELEIRKDLDELTSIEITNYNTGSNSSEGIYFNNEDGSIAGIRIYDYNATYSSQMRLFNSRPNGSIHFLSENGNLVLDKTGNLSVYNGDILTQGTNSFQTNGDEAILKLGDNFNHIKAVYGFGIKIGVFGVANSAIAIEAGTGNVGIGTESPSRKLYVNGSAGGTENWNASSDRRLKKNIKTIPDALEKLNNLRGVNFEWKEQKTYSEGLKMGFIAQEAKEVIPEVVQKKGEYYSMQYAPITALLVEAVKEQNKKFRTQNAELKERLEKLEKIVTELTNKRNSTKLTSVVNYKK